MLRDELTTLVEAAVERLIAAGTLPEAVREVAVEISDTKSPEHGDYACNLALVAAKKAGVAPRQFGEHLRMSLLSDENAPFEGIDVAGPGFINMRLKPAYVASFVEKVLAKGTDYARLTPAIPQRINVEFVSVNPNGPITVGSGRGAAFGSTLCNVLDAAGSTVHREYYINDGVNSEQMRLFAESVRSILLGIALPEKGYKGEYVHEAAAIVSDQLTPERIQAFIDGYASGSLGYKADSAQGSSYNDYMVALYQDVAKKVTSGSREEIVKSLSTEQLQRLSEYAMMGQQASALELFGVKFDQWFNEQALHTSDKVKSCIAELVQKGVADEEPTRTVLKLAKSGKIDQVQKEVQTGLVTDDDDTPNSETSANATVNATANTLWLRSTKFGDDMDRVLRRQDGRLTYIASDVAYHADKLNRPAPGADKLITILGPDHHGYIGRLQAVFAALLPAQHAEVGSELSEIESQIYKSKEERDTCQAALAEAKRRLEVVIFQIVRFVKDGKPAPMRKRDGNIYELRDLIQEIGKNIAPEKDVETQHQIGADVSRFFYLMRSHDTHMDFDIDLATKQNDENPVFYVQYAHARICSVLRKAEEEGLTASGADLSVLAHPRETALIKKILDLPMEVSRCAKDYGVHRLTTYAIELARSYHHFYDACRVIQADQPELSKARLELCSATKTALKAAFDLLGVSAPERM